MKTLFPFLVRRHKTVFLILTILIQLCLTRNIIAEKIWPKEPLRGINVKLVTWKKGNTQNPGSYISENTFKKLSTWNINHIRVTLFEDEFSEEDTRTWEKMPAVHKNELLAPYRENLEGLEHVLKLAEKYHIYVIPAAGFRRNTDILYEESGVACFQTTLVELWKYIAKEFGTNPWLLGYDLLNEPNSKNEIQYWWNVTVPTLVREIRAIDKDTYLVVQPTPWGNVEGFRKLTPIKDPKVVYSFHFYRPHNYTHQGVGVHKLTKGKFVYPGNLINFDTSPEIYWDRNQMCKEVADVLEFQEKYSVRIWCGEFSAIRWAPGAAQWIADAISVFEVYGWNWCYYSYGEWNGFNPTFAHDSKENFNPDGGERTDRLQVLENALKLNRKY